MNEYRNLSVLHKCLLTCIYLLVTIFYLACVSHTSSPLTESYANDSSVFMAMGKMFLDGMVPYAEYFDHKGPVIILIEAVAQFVIPSRGGIFMIQTLFFFFTVLFIHKTARLVLNIQKTFIVILLSFIYLTIVLSGGNQTEEYSLLFLFISLYIGCKYLFENKEIRYIDAFILGLCFSFLFWMRLNNAGTICAVTAFLFFSTLAAKKYKLTLKLVLGFLLGQLPLSIMFCLYFLYHDALYDLMYSTFLFNMNYVGSLISISPKYFWINVLAFLLLAYGSYKYYKKTEKKDILLFAGLIFFFNFITINVGYVYRHYFVLMTPAIVFGIILCLDVLRKEKALKILFILSVLGFLGASIGKGIPLIKRSKSKKIEISNYRSQATQLLNNVKQADKNRVYYYQVKSAFYPIMNLNTNYKYFIMPVWHMEHDKQIEQDICDILRSDKYPKWILVEKEMYYSRTNVQVQNVMDENYSLHSETDVFILYKHN